MPDHIVLSRTVRVGRTPPDGAELDALRSQGVRAVIDLRAEDEPFGRAGAPATEAVNVRSRGMTYVHVPVSAQGVDRHDLDRVGEALAQAPKPVLIHCAVGRRAGMIALAHAAIESGVPGSEMLEMARHLDVAFGTPDQQDVFVRYVDQHETRADPLKRRREALRADGQTMPLLPKGTRTLAGELQDDHRRAFAPDDGPPLTPAPLDSVPRVPMRTSLVAHRAMAAPARLPSPAALAAVAAIGASILLALDRRLLLLAAATAACVAVARSGAFKRRVPTEERARLDHEIADLDARLRRLAKIA